MLVLTGVRSIPIGARLFAAGLLIYCVCPPFTGYDSYYVVPTALSILTHGSMAVDEFVSGAPPISGYAVDCIPARGTAIPYPGGGCPGGHWYNYFTPGVPILAAPLVGVILLVTKALSALFPHAAALAPHPIIAAVLSADLMGGHAIVELLCASFFGGLAVSVLYAINRCFLPVRDAVWLTLLFAFGTPEWSIGSRNLAQHGLTILLLGLAAYLAILARERPHLIQYLSIPLALSFAVRPSNCIAVAVLTVYVAIHYRAYFWRFVAWAAPIATALLAYNLVLLHEPISRYYHFDSADRVAPSIGFPMHWFSPNRGILVFTPVFVFSLVGVWVAVRKRWLWPLAPYLAAIIGLHSLLISRYFGGHSYGSRYFADMTSLFAIFLIPAVLQWRKMAHGTLRSGIAAAFLICAAWGVFVHARGATSPAANRWSASPINVDEARWRVWDWSDPQWLRGLR